MKEFVGYSTKSKNPTMPFSIKDIGDDGTIRNQTLDGEYYNITDLKIIQHLPAMKIR
jgi:hypothetical protein